MYHNLVVTCGISLLTENNLIGRHLRLENKIKFNRTNPVLTVGKTVEEELNSILPKLRPLFGNAKQTPLAVSAEYSLLNAFKIKNILGSSPRLMLLHSDTFGGCLSAVCLKEIIEKDFQAVVALEVINELDMDKPNKVSRAISRFMLKIGECLRAYPDISSTCLAPLGGYKVMTSYGYIAGSFYGFPSAYLHEDMQLLHFLPAMPIEIKSDFVMDNEKFIRRLLNDDIVEYKNLSYKEKKNVTDNPFLFESAGDLITLNAFGRFIFLQPQYTHLFGTKMYLSPEAQNDSAQYPGADKFIAQQLSLLINKINADPEGFWGELHHELGWSNLKNKALKFFLYKGSSNGQLVFRAAWDYDKNKDILYINKIWCDHDIYEKEVNSGIGFFSKSEKWSDMTKQYLSKILIV